MCLHLENCILHLPMSADVVSWPTSDENGFSEAAPTLSKSIVSCCVMLEPQYIHLSTKKSQYCVVSVWT